MIDKDIKIKFLESELESRQTQVLQLESKVALLEMRINQNVNVLELQEEIKMLESQNLKLVEKNQSDFVEWKTKEREFRGKVTIIIKQELKKPQGKLASIKAELDMQLIVIQQLTKRWIKNQQSDQNDLKQINENLIYNENLLILEKEQLQNQVKDLEEDKKQIQNSFFDQNNKRNKELEILREHLHKYQGEIVQREKQMRNLSSLEQQMENKIKINEEEVEVVKRQKDYLQIENDSLKKYNEKQVQEIQFLDQQINSYSKQDSIKDRQLQDLQNIINDEYIKVVTLQQNTVSLQEKLKEIKLNFEHKYIYQRK
ncbi:unnamed protein product [Paramecium sonneborni]|uniref:Uncharacterized protein n=1 Tax=Paramecium sonneborni TaxID=65129 RepID=A0A8S1RC54_9CILI|nr:unnamed protein product [Paramecium sonneborni]